MTSDALQAIQQQLAEIREAVASPSPAKRFLGIDEAAAYSGLSTKSLRRLIGSGKLTALKPVGKILLDIRQLDQVILGSGPARRRR